MSSRADVDRSVADRHLEPYAFAGDPTSRLIGTSIHAGHDVRPEIASLLAIDERARRREEDPFTDRIAASAGSHVRVFRSRFEVDLNRAREHAVYRTPDECWGLEVWRGDPPAGAIERSLDLYDSFYADLAEHLDRLAAIGPFVLLDVHSYNHRRAHEGAPPEPEEDNPEVNVGTGSMPRHWRTVVETLIQALGEGRIHGRPLDVRENVRFEGGQLVRWVHERYPATGCAFALEFKKTFMNEWTGTVDVDHLDALAHVVHAAQEPTLAALRRAA